MTKGIPFRETHGIVGRIVRECAKDGRELTSLSLAELRRFSLRFDRDVADRLTVRGAIDRKRQIGGTARKLVEKRLKTWEQTLR